MWPKKSLFEIDKSFEHIDQNENDHYKKTPIKIDKFKSTCSKQHFDELVHEDKRTKGIILLTFFSKNIVISCRDSGFERIVCQIVNHRKLTYVTFSFEHLFFKK